MKENVVVTKLNRHNEMEKQIELINASGKYDFNHFRRYANVIKHIKGEIPELSAKDKKMIEDDQRVLREMIKIQDEITVILKKEV